jgi:hypothetical protein
MITKLLLVCIGLLSIIAPQNAVCQGLGPVDTSGFAKDHPVQASVTEVSTSACRIISAQDGALHHYDITLSGKAKFVNHSQKPAILVKQPFILTVRIAASIKDLTSGKYIAGLDGDRMAISSMPQPVSIYDFELVDPGRRYLTNVSTTVPLRPKSDLVGRKSIGKYWVQLGIDARPDAFYYEPSAQKEFARKWRKRGKLVDFVLTKPFLIDVALGSNTPICKQ